MNQILKHGGFCICHIKFQNLKMKSKGITRVITIHPEENIPIANIFLYIYHILGGAERKVMGPKVNRVHPLRTMNICINISGILIQ